MARHLAIALLVALVAAPASAVKVADITRISGQRTNVLSGLGLVFGLKGTGDGGDFEPAIKPLAAMLSKYANPTTVRALQNVQNVAVVSVTATIPAEGARNGDRIDCYVTAIGKATSLKSGRLFIIPLMGPNGQPHWSGLPYALAEGPIDLEETGSTNVGVVKRGAVMEVNVEPETVVAGQFELVLEGPAAGWITASGIAQVINGAEGAAGQTIAVAKDAKTVIVSIPKEERERPDAFISRIQRLPVPSQLLSTEARVVINTKMGSVVMTGDVEISPVVISLRGLTITTVTPAPKATELTPITTERTAVALDTTGAGGAKLNDLLAVFDQLKVPAEDRITIIKELHKTGKLHAKLITE
ncbi:MAG TPA: flagellar basal body P-ring protein FlgI [Tepidisphaeraceae bacterium]|nr:flagellar basal body P-ring protein FlgI [Tepidisphaeraceae bacterium]